MSVNDPIPRTADFGWRFAGLFAFYSGLMLLALQLTPLDVIQKAAEATASASVFFWRAFSVPLVKSGFMLNLLGFQMEVTLECTAAHYIVIMAGAVLAYPSHTFRYKAAGLLALIPSIILLNLVRIGLLGLVGHYASRFFPVVHTILWQGLFALSVLVLWIVWVRGGGDASRLLLRYCILGFAGAIASYGVLSLSLPYYARLLAAVAGAVGRPLSVVADFPSAVRADGGLIAYRVSGGWADYRVSVDIMNTIVFCTLFAMTAPYSDRPRLMKMALSGFGTLFILHVGYVVMYGIICAGGIDENSLGDITRGFAFMAPLLTWLLVTLLFRPGAKS